MSSFLQPSATKQETAARGRSLFSDEEWNALARSLKLSSREFQITRGLFDDETEAVIAIRLSISPHTVHTYLDRLYRKLAARNRCQLLVRVFAEHRRQQA